MSRHLTKRDPAETHNPGPTYTGVSYYEKQWTRLSIKEKRNVVSLILIAVALVGLEISYAIQIIINIPQVNKTEVFDADVWTGINAIVVFGIIIIIVSSIRRRLKDAGHGEAMND